MIHIQRQRRLFGRRTRYLAYCNDPISADDSVVPGRFRNATCPNCLRHYAIVVAREAKRARTTLRAVREVTP